MKYLLAFLCGLLFFACNVGFESGKQTSTNEDSSLSLELDNMFKIGENRFVPEPLEGGYKVVLQKGKTYRLNPLSAQGNWSFSVAGLRLIGNNLEVPEDAAGSYTLSAKQNDSRYDQLVIFVEIVVVEESIFDGDKTINLFTGSEDFGSFLEGLSANVELSQLRVQLDGEDIDPRQFEWEYQLFSLASSSARAVNPSAGLVAKAQGTLALKIEELNPATRYKIKVVGRPTNLVAGTIVKDYVFSTAATFQERDIFPILLYPPFKAGTTVEPILSGNLGNGKLNYTLKTIIAGASVNKDSGSLTLKANYAGEDLSVNLQVEATSNYNGANVSYSSKVEPPTLLELLYYLKNESSSTGKALISTAYVKDAVYSVTLPAGWNGSEVTYSANPQGIVNINSETGAVTVLKSGKVIITATYQEKQASATFVFGSGSENISISYTIDTSQPLPWVLTAQKTGSAAGRKEAFYVHADDDVATIADDGTLTVNKNENFSVTWLVFAAGNNSASTATWGYYKGSAVVPERPHFEKTQLVYDSSVQFIHPYDADKTHIEFNFGSLLAPNSKYFQVKQDTQLYARKVGGQEVIAKVFVDDVLVDVSQTWLQVQPKELVLERNDIFYGRLDIIREIRLPEELFNFNLKLRARHNPDLITFYSRDSNDAQGWIENDGLLSCTADCRFGIKASKEGYYNIVIESNDENLVIIRDDYEEAYNNSLRLRYEVEDAESELFYSRFKTQVTIPSLEFAPMQPIWRIEEPDNLTFSSTASITGLQINETNGEIQFDTLAHLAAADGQSITITATNNDGSWKTEAPLQIHGGYSNMLKDLVKAFIDDPNIGPEGKYNAIYTGDVNSMVFLFSDFKSFNGDISNWDVSKVRDMYGMFAGLKDFNGDISKWDTSQVEKMDSMFSRAEAFNQDISKWDVSKVRNMSSMFSGTKAFDQDISKWDTSQVENMYWMFKDAEAFNQNIGSWDVSKVRDMDSMFKDATAFKQNIRGWSVQLASNSYGLSSMFVGATAFNDENSNGATTEAANYFTVLQDK